MVNLLRKIFIKNYNNVNDPRVRGAHGKLASIFGVISNLFLFIIKLFAGIISSSVSIIADSINNLSDMGSSIVTLVGFKLANAPADSEHPYGHQRIEYVAGLIVSIFIIFVGGNLFFSSVETIISYKVENIDQNILVISIVILSISILIKLWQSYVNRKIGKIINSVALEATSRDSLNDCFSTLTLLVGNVVLLFVKDMPFSLDGVMGIVVSIFILISGIKLIKETVNPLIGVTFDEGLIKQVTDILKEEPLVLGYHDPICHSYGPTMYFMTIHIEVDQNEKMIDVHDAVDNLEKKVFEKCGVILTIHMDPIQTDNEEVNNLRKRVKEAVSQIDSHLAMHDFRVVMGPTHTNLIFDIIVPFKFHLTEADILRSLQELITDDGIRYEFTVNFDKEYVKNEIMNKEY